MNYEHGFLLLAAFIVGYIVKGLKLYIGPNEDKYNAANFGILLERR